MKSIFLLLFLWVACTISAQNKYTIFSNEKSQYGIRQNVEPYDTLIECEYDKIQEFDESFLLCDKYKIQKHSVYPISVKNAKWVDGDLNEIKSFDKLEVYTEHLIDQSRKKQDVYYIPSKQIFAEQVEILDVVVKNHMKYYGDKSFDYVIFYEENGQYKVVNQANEILITFLSKQKKLEWDADFKVYKYGNKKDYSVYSEDFKLIAEHVTFMNKIQMRSVNSKSNFMVFGNTQGKQMLFRDHLKVKEIDGNFLLNTGNPDRFVYKEDDFYYVINSSGESVVDTAYQLLYPNISFENKHANMVQSKNGDYYFVDNEYSPISDEVFESIKSVEKNYIFTYYVVTRPNQTEDGFYLYSSKGNLIVEKPVDKAYEKDGIICLEKEGKIAFVNWEHEVSDFLFSNTTLLDNSDGELLLLDKNGENQVYSLYYNKMIEVPGSYQDVRLLPSYYPLTLEYSNSNEILLVAVQTDFPTTENIKLTDIEGFDESEFDPQLGLYFTKNYSGAWGVLKLTNNGFEILIGFEYDDIFFDIEFFDISQLFQVTKNDKVGLVAINVNESTEIIEPKYDDIIFDLYYLDITSNLIPIKHKGRYGLIDIYTGKEIVPPIVKNHKSLTHVADQIIDYYVEKPIECEVSGKNKKCIFTKGVACFDDIQFLVNELPDEMLVKVDEKYGTLSYEGDTLIDLVYDEIVYLKDMEHYKVKKDGKWGMLYYSREEIVQPIYDDIYIGGDEFFYIVKNEDKYGALIGQDSKIPIEYDAVEIYGDHAFVKKGKKWGAYTLYDVKLVEPFNYSSLEELMENMGY